MSSDTPTPRTAKQLVGVLREASMTVGMDEARVNPSRASLDRHDEAMRRAEAAILERIEQLEKRLAEARAEVERLQSIVDKYGEIL